MELESTVCRLSTPRGTGGVHVIRVSGPKAIHIANQLFQSGTKAAATAMTGTGKAALLSAHRPRQMVYGRILDENGEVLDYGMVVYFKGPHSFTGEDTVEFHCHGGLYIAEKIEEALVAKGCHLAERGEFSKRAFLNGKMDLTQAEAVMDMIDARTSLSLRSAEGQLEGRLYQRVEGLRKRLVRLMADVSVNLDYPEYEDLPEITHESLEEEIQSLLEEVEDLLSTADSGRLLREGVRVAFVGQPNVGKSSLMNHLLGRERAIVTPIPGTTRDTLEEMYDMDGILLRLIDTAGVHETDDPVEKIGVERALKALSESDLVLYVADDSDPAALENLPIVKEAEGKSSLVLLNKADLREGKREEASANLQFLPKGATVEDILVVSAKTGEGMEQISRKIKEKLFPEKALSEVGSLVTNERQKEALIRAKSSLFQALQNSDLPEDILMIDLLEAGDALGEVSGANAREEIISDIFSRFCLGK